MAEAGDTGAPAPGGDDELQPANIEQVQKELEEEKNAHKATLERLEAELASEKDAHRVTLEKLEQMQVWFDCSSVACILSWLVKI